MACFAHMGVLGAEPLTFAEPGVRPSYAPDRRVRVTHASIQLTVDPTERTFQGQARLAVVPLPTYAGRFSFDLDDVVVDAVTDGAGVALDYEHVDGRIRIVATVAPDQVNVRWHGVRPTRGLYFTGPTAADPDRAAMAWTQCQDEDGHFVFPCHDHPSVKHPWTLELVAPVGYTLLSNGAPIGGGTNDTQVWARFEQADPMPAYLVTFVAAKLSAVTTSWRGKPVRYLVPQGEEAHVEGAFGRTPAMIDHFSDRLGVPYPWPRYDQVVVHDFVFGGMENVACTTMTDMILVDGKASLEWRPDGLVAHELAHQWFGDLVTCQDWSQAWLNESWATYLEAIWWEHAHGTAEATWYRFGKARGYLDEHDTRYRRPIVSYDFREPIDLFDRHLYNKGSCVLWTLRRHLGEAAFWAGVRRYLETHAHQTVHTRHFQRAMEDASGFNLDGFFEQWIHRAGHPVVDVTVAQDGSDLAVTVAQTQGEGDEACFDFTLRLEIVSGGRPRTVDLRITERERTFVLPGLGSESHVRIDPDLGVLAEITLKGPDRWLEVLAEDPCPVLAVRGIRALMARDTQRCRAAVVAALTHHPFYGVREAAATELAKQGTVEARTVLVEGLAAETDPRVRRAIASALGGFRCPEAADALIALLAEDLPTWQLEGAALVALGSTRDPRARSVIAPHLDRSSWADWVASRALDGLAQTQDPSVLELLVAQSTPNHGDRRQAAAAGALGRLAAVVEAPIRTAAVERLITLVAQGSFRVQMASIGALGHAGDPAALACLTRIHRSAPDGRARRMAYEAMARIRRGRTPEAGLSALRRQVERLAEDNARLKSRLDHLEGAPGARDDDSVSG